MRNLFQDIVMRPAVIRVLHAIGMTNLSRAEVDQYVQKLQEDRRQQQESQQPPGPVNK